MGTRWQRAESTGVYWIPLFEILEQRGIRPCLVTARHMKNVPGRHAKLKRQAKQLGYELVPIEPQAE